VSYIGESCDVIVVGAGHAGCEAALASARMGLKTTVFTISLDNIALMPCNPSVGGPAKGHLVREIDALGGEMGKNIDKSYMQIKMLNTSKGPAVHALRAQADKKKYQQEMYLTMSKEKNLKVKQGLVEKIIVEDGEIKGVQIQTGGIFYSKAVVITAGTYMDSRIIIGDLLFKSGPQGFMTTDLLSKSLAENGVELLRLKTGTPARLERSSIDFSKTKIQEGDSKPYTFSFENKIYYDVNNQEPCHLIYTTKETKKIILENLNKSSMYGGLNDIKGVGPRYCPSIEDKIVRFSDKDVHQIFLEPESKFYDDIYVQGFSTSMPKDVQEKMIHSLPGLEKAKILKYAYAIEYDAIYPTQLNKNLETKVIENLFTAGQINGTSGYEEAACQGLMAGINVFLKSINQEPFVLNRNEAYIGVLIDDLVTKGTNEPYRLLTSRAEYRLLLRHDNADIRLMEYGYKYNLISKERYLNFKKKVSQIESLKEEINEKKLSKFLKTTENSIFTISNLDKFSDEVKEQVEINIKYEGYIKKTLKEAEKMLKLEYKKIPKDIDYDKIKNIATEARQKLNKIKPETIGQAMRISGINPSDISVLMIYMKRYFYE